jgi:hypothetical protein
MQPETTQKNFLPTKGIQNSRIFLDEKAKYHPWIKKRSHKLDEEA